MPEALLDTSGWLAQFRRESAAGAVMLALQGRTVVVSVVGLAELSSYGGRNGLAPSAATAVLGNARVEALTPEDAEAGGRLHGNFAPRTHAR